MKYFFHLYNSAQKKLNLKTTLVLVLFSLGCSPSNHKVASTSKSYRQLDFHQTCLQVPGKISEVKLIDTNNDSQKDILVLHSEYIFKQDSTARMTSLFIFQDNSFPSEPCTTLVAKQNDILVDWLELTPHSDHGYLLNLRTNGLWGYPISSLGYVEPIRQFLNEPSLFPVADQNRLSFANLHADVDGDGMPELILPHANQLNIYQSMQDQKYKLYRSYLFPLDLQIHHTNWADNSTGLPTVTVRSPKFIFKDFNGDGVNDLIGTFEDNVSVYLTKIEGITTVHKPDTTFDLGVITWEEKIANEAGKLEIIVEDINGDNKADVLVRKLAASPLGHSIGQMQIYLNRFGRLSPVPDQILTTRHLKGEHILCDFNRDGMLDMAMLGIKLDLTSLFRLLLSKSLQSEYRFYLMEKEGRYPKRPNQKMRFVHKIDLRNPLQYLPVQNFDGDFNGDARTDLLVQTGEDELSIYLGQYETVFAHQPALMLNTKVSPYLIVDDINMDQKSDLLFWYEKENGNEWILNLFLSR